MALASPFQHILHLLFKTFLTLSKGDVKKLKIFLCVYSFPCPHIKICWNGGVQPFSLGMGIDHACFRSSRAVTALSTFWVDILPPWGTLSDRSVTEIAIASPSNETEHCFVWCLCCVYIVCSLIHKGFWLKWPICMRASYLDWKCCVRKCLAERSSQRCRFCALVVFCRSILGLVETALDGDDQRTMDDQWCWLRQITTSATSCKYCWVNHWDQISLQRALSRNVIEVCGNFSCFLGVGGMHPLIRALVMCGPWLTCNLQQMWSGVRTAIKIEWVQNTNAHSLIAHITPGVANSQTLLEIQQEQQHFYKDY